MLLREDQEEEQHEVISSLDLVGPLQGLTWLLITSCISSNNDKNRSHKHTSTFANGSSSNNGSSRAGSSASNSSSVGGSGCGSSFWLDVGQRLQQEGWPVNILQIVPLGEGQDGVSTGVAAAAGDGIKGARAAAAGGGGASGSGARPAASSEMGASGVVEQITGRSSTAAAAVVGVAVAAKRAGEANGGKQHHVWQAVDVSGGWQDLHKELHVPPPAAAALAGSGAAAAAFKASEAQGLPSASGHVVEVVVLVRPDGHVAWRGMGVKGLGLQQGHATVEGPSNGVAGRIGGSWGVDEGGSWGGMDEAVKMMSGLMRQLLCLKC